MNEDLARAAAAAVDDLDRQVGDRKFLRAERYRERYERDPEFRAREQARSRTQGRRAYRKLGTAERLYQSSKRRAKQQGVPFGLTVGYLRQIWPESGKCPVLGFRMLLDGEVGQGPSLDRIDPALGYVEGNVRIISMRANALRSDGTWSELARVAAYAASRDMIAYQFEDGDLAVRVLRKI